jgi:DNA polymerase-3 subunit epsilon
LEPEKGHRIIEIGAVELVDRRLTQRHFHQYVQPDRDIDDAAMEVHGITLEFLADKPRFTDVAADFLTFIDGAELIIHNAPFDVSFLDFELSMLDPVPGRVEDFASVVDSLALARHKHPGQKNNLDALCRRYYVDNSQRERHGALLDAEILADVYLLMTGGQTMMFSGDQENASAANTGWEIVRLPADRPPLLVVEPSPEERVAHAAVLDLLDEASAEGSVWRGITAAQNAS